MNEEDYLVAIEKESRNTNIQFRSLPKKLLNNKNFLLRVIDVYNKGWPCFFEEVSEEIKSDKDISLRIVAKNGTNAYYIPKYFRNDKEIILRAFENGLISTTVIGKDLRSELKEKNCFSIKEIKQYLSMVLLQEELSVKDNTTKKFKL